MKPVREKFDGVTGLVYGKVTMKDGSTKKIAMVMIDDGSWPIIPISVACWGGEFVDCSDHPDSVENWRNRGDLDLHEGHPK
jgi:hypothetical protein